MNEKKISLVEQNQDFKGHPIYYELRNCPKTYFSGYRMLVTITNKILNFKQHFMPKSATFQNNNKNDSPSGACTPPGGTMFLSEILILVGSNSYLSMVEKAKWFFERNKFNFSK